MILVTMALLIVALAFWLWTHVEMSRVARCVPFLRADAAATLPGKPPKVSVIVPAHNEALNLRRALDALLAQGYPDFEVIVADDRSADDTAAIAREYAARDARVRVIELHDHPDGWAGKPWVLHKAAEQARGEVLLLLDADVALDPGALAMIVARFLEGGLDLLSLYFRHEGSSAVEEIVHVLLGVVVQLLYPLKKINEPSSPVAMANGQCMMVRAEVYREFGAHEDIRGRVQEDLLLARALKRSGRPIETAYGFDAGAAKWYSTLGAMWTGWTRNIYGLSEGRFDRLLLGLAFVTEVILVPCVALIGAAAGLCVAGARPGTVAVLAASAANLVLMMATFWRLLRLSRGRLRCLPLLPWAGVIFAAMLAAAVFNRVTGRGLVWRGKRYNTGPDGISV